MHFSSDVHYIVLQTNTFQCVLATSLMESFVMFIYADGGIQWTTGDGSGGTNGLGGTEALAGINAGDGINSITVPGSLTPGIINVTQTSNVGNPGVWMFEVDEGKLVNIIGINKKSMACSFPEIISGKSLAITFISNVDHKCIGVKLLAL